MKLVTSNFEEEVDLFKKYKSIVQKFWHVYNDDKKDDNLVFEFAALGMEVDDLVQKYPQTLK